MVVPYNTLSEAEQAFSKPSRYSVADIPLIKPKKNKKNKKKRKAEDGTKRGRKHRRRRREKEEAAAVKADLEAEAKLEAMMGAEEEEDGDFMETDTVDMTKDTSSSSSSDDDDAQERGIYDLDKYLQSTGTLPPINVAEKHLMQGDVKGVGTNAVVPMKQQFFDRLNDTSKKDKRKAKTKYIDRAMKLMRTKMKSQWMDVLDHMMETLGETRTHMLLRPLLLNIKTEDDIDSFIALALHAHYIEVLRAISEDIVDLPQPLFAKLMKAFVEDDDGYRLKAFLNEIKDRKHQRNPGMMLIKWIGHYVPSDHFDKDEWKEFELSEDVLNQFLDTIIEAFPSESTYTGRYGKYVFEFLKAVKKYHTGVKGVDDILAKYKLQCDEWNTEPSYFILNMPLLLL